MILICDPNKTHINVEFDVAELEKFKISPVVHIVLFA